MAITLAITCILKFRRKKPMPAELATQPYVMPFDAHDVRSQSSQPNMADVPASSPLYSSPSPDSSRVSNYTPLQQNFNSSPGTNFATPIDSDSTMPYSPSPPQGKDPNSGNARLSTSTPDSPADQYIPDQLTNEQAAYVQNMYSLNVPASAIAVVVERMMQGGRSTRETSSGGFGVRRGNTTTTMPPSYADS